MLLFCFFFIENGQKSSKTILHHRYLHLNSCSRTFGCSAPTQTNQLVIVLLEYTLQNKKGICVCADKDFFTLAVCHLTLDR